ncbi:MAG TPA: hypothetical protein VHD82_11765 [Amycolatopsis sp.]|nr:hypothetical protein [Amycolatopsis sp.]HVV09922.1 hypothetical protein [Amycolatopsis sp.]
MFEQDPAPQHAECLIQCEVIVFRLCAAFACPKENLRHCGATAHRELLQHFRRTLSANCLCHRIAQQLFGRGGSTKGRGEEQPEILLE